MRALGRPRAVVFDLFNTLVPGGTRDQRDEVSRQMATHLGVAPEQFADLMRDTFDERTRGRLGGLAFRNTAITKVTAGLASGVWLLVLAGCGNTPSERVVLPPKDAPASLVLETYLHALQAGDCGSAHALAASTFTVSNGDLCGAVQVKNFMVHDPPAQIGPDEVEYATELTTGGSHDGSASLPDR